MSLYAHKDTGKKMLLRRSGNRNDGVYRALRGKRLCNLPMVLEVCSEEAHLLVLEEYIEGRTLDKILDSGQLTSAQAAAIPLTCVMRWKNCTAWALSIGILNPPM